MNGVAETVAVQVPPSSELSEAQRSGRCCVWCGAALTSCRTVDLGERDDGERHLFPRGCQLCAAEQVYPQLIEHAASCEQCVDNNTLCPASAELRRALREGRSR